MADLRGADLSHAIFIEANLSGTIFHEAQLGWTTFGDVDLSTVQGLDPTTQKGPSTLGVDTRYRSKGRIPDVFLRGPAFPGTSFPTSNRSSGVPSSPIPA
jgi:hypothetical protein